MARLIYSALTSLDGYVVDETGDFDWAAPDEEVHAAVSNLERTVGTYLYGRRMYDVMAAWETMPTGADQSAVTTDFADIWRATDKVVYSRTLEAPRTARTRVERSFDPVAVRELVASADQDMTVGGSDLAGQALAAGLVDELHQFVSPVVVGGGTGWLPRKLRVDLELLSARRFAGGVVHLHYRTRS